MNGPPCQRWPPRRTLHVIRLHRMASSLVRIYIYALCFFSCASRICCVLTCAAPGAPSGDPKSVLKLYNGEKVRAQFLSLLCKWAYSAMVNTAAF